MRWVRRKACSTSGRGAGSYEPADRNVTALEPSLVMIGQRPPGAAPAIQGRAEELPFADNSFDAVMAVLTVHHWSDPARGMAEMRRVSRGPLVICTFDPAQRGCWLTDYLPELIELDERILPPMADYARWLGPIEVTPVPVPHDCSDGFLYAYWRRPQAYLDPRVRLAISSFWAIGEVDDRLAALADDLASGAWAERYGAVLERETLDIGYRLVVAR